MDLNKEIHEIVLDGMDLAQQENWSKADKFTRAVYDTFRIQNIVEKFDVTQSSLQFNEKYKTDFDEFIKVKCKPYDRLEFVYEGNVYGLGSLYILWVQTIKKNL